FGPFAPVVPDEPKVQTDEAGARAALAGRLLDAGEDVAAALLDYHRREGKPVWWWFFERLDMTQEELLEDGESIAGLQAVGAPEEVKKSKAWTFTFPAQESKLRVGQDVRDPSTGDRAGDLTALDREQRRLVLKRGPS